MQAVVIYESLTGTARRAGELIAATMTADGVATKACPITNIDMQALSDADLVVIGTWTDGFVMIGQRPGRASRLRKMPALAGKQCVVYCTYAIDAGHVLEKLQVILEDLGAEVLGGMTIRRDKVPEQVATFVERTLAAVGA